ncbi:TMV resistance protein N-like isoform X1 [Senna tora]|uniref:TMV resistance protein N-like isoform X1 n=1 Tax=Senna tora TaxID=362788 RepID=A0A834W7H3_9FABA|nr:TMV resistance protein N-like isoform X1 [Senna tora]
MAPQGAHLGLPQLSVVHPPRHLQSVTPCTVDLGICATKNTEHHRHDQYEYQLIERIGSNKINAVIVEYWPKGEVNWDGEALKRMKNLKILIFKRIRFSEVPKYLPNSLRVLYWWGYPASCLPVDFHPRNLVELDLPNSCLQSIIMGQAKRFENLSVLNLSECSFITQISDISGIPNLTELCLKNCENLIKIDDSVGYLRKLQRLDAYDCENLRHFPRCLKLPTLEDLSLTGCSSLRKFPEIQEKMECITSLDLSRTNLGLPFSIRNLTALEEIIMEDYGRGLHLSSSISLLPEPKDTNIEGCQAQECPEMSSILFPNMEEIVLNRCNISDGFLPICLTWFVNVKHLDLRRSNFMILPACIKECLYLKSLDLSDCMHLREVRGIPPNIEQLYAMNCISLNSESRSLLMSQELHDTGSKKFWVSGSTMPRWVSHHTLSLWFRDQIPTISFCCVLRKHLHHHSIFDKLLIDVVINGDKIKMCDDFLFYPHSNMLVEDVVVLVRIICCGDDKVSLASEWNHVEVKAKTIYGSHYASKKETCVEEVGIYVKELKHRREDIQFINPHKRKKLFHDFNLGSSFMASRRTHDITSNKDTYANSQEGVGDGAPIESLKLTCKRDGQFTSTSELKYEIAKVAYQGRLVDCEGAERFIQLMQRHNHNTDQSDLHARFLLLQVIKDSLAHCHEKTNEEDADFNCKFHVLFIKALPLLNKWLQDILKGKFHNIENDELVKRFLSASLEAMYKMVPVSLYQLQSFGVVKSVKLLLKHKSPHIWLKAESLINRWKFHLDAEEENSLASLLEEDPELSKTEIGGEKLKDDANHASSSSMSNAIVSRVVHVGERAIDSSNSQSKQDEAVTNEIDILLEKCIFRRDNSVVYKAELVLSLQGNSNSSAPDKIIAQSKQIDHNLSSRIIGRMDVVRISPPITIDRRLRRTSSLRTAITRSL